MLTFLALFTSLTEANVPETPPQAVQHSSWRLRERAPIPPEVDLAPPVKRGHVISARVRNGVISLYLLTDDGGFICGGPAENCLNMQEGQEVYTYSEINLCEFAGHRKRVDFIYDFMDMSQMRLCELEYCMPSVRNQTCDYLDMHPLDARLRHTRCFAGMPCIIPMRRYLPARLERILSAGDE